MVKDWMWRLYLFSNSILGLWVTESDGRCRKINQLQISTLYMVNVLKKKAWIPGIYNYFYFMLFLCTEILNVIVLYFQECKKHIQFTKSISWLLLSWQHQESMHQQFGIDLQSDLLYKMHLSGQYIVDHSDVVGALPVGAAPTTSSFST